MSDLMDTMRAIQTGERTVEDVAAEFRTRSWPQPARATQHTARASFANQLTDRDPDPPGSFSEVAGAFYQGIITIDQYAVLCDAAAEAIAASSAQMEATSDGGGAAGCTARTSSGLAQQVTAGIYAQVLQGASKDACRHVTDEETAAYWDHVEAEVQEMRGRGYIFDIPIDIGSPLEDLGITQEQMSAAQALHAERRTEEAARGGLTEAQRAQREASRLANERARLRRLEDDGR